MSQPPVPAATILLLLETDHSMVVFMQERHRDIKAFGSMLVFPGGKVADQDRDPLWQTLCRGVDDNNRDQLVFQIAAIRETFEESGLLLARRRGSGQLLNAAEVTALNAQQAVQTGELSFLDCISRHQLELACDLLVHYAHWITPVVEARRFDTHFYLTRVPPEQQELLQHDGHEAVDSLWIAPAVAVADAAAGRRKLIFPTIRNLERLAQYASVQQALEASASQVVQAIHPQVDMRADGVYVCIPADAGYPVCEQRIPDDMVNMLTGKT